MDSETRAHSEKGLDQAANTVKIRMRSGDTVSFSMASVYLAYFPIKSPTVAFPPRFPRTFVRDSTN